MITEFLMMEFRMHNQGCA